MAQETESLQALTGHLGRLEATVDEALTKARRRNARGWIASGLVLAALSGYLGFAYHECAKIDPDLAFGLGSEKVKERMPAVFAEFRHQARAMAPGLVRQGETALLALPEKLHDTLKAQVDAQLASGLPAVEEGIYQQLKTVLDQELAKHPHDGLTPEQRYAQILETVRVKSNEFIGETYARYLERSDEVVGYLEHLASAQNLTERETLQREVLRTLMTMVRQHQAQKSAES